MKTPGFGTYEVVSEAGITSGKEDRSSKTMALEKGASLSSFCESSDSTLLPSTVHEAKNKPRASDKRQSSDAPGCHLERLIATSEPGNSVKAVRPLVFEKLAQTPFPTQEQLQDRFHRPLQAHR